MEIPKTSLNHPKHTLNQAPNAAEQMLALPRTLADLGVSVSTGRVARDVVADCAAMLEGAG